MTRVIKDVFGNLCIFNFFILLWGYLYRDNKIEELVGSVKMKIKIGCGMGVLGVLFMVYNIQFADGAPFLDLRIIALMVSTYIGGITAAIVCGTIISVVRVSFFGLNITSIIGIVVIYLCILSYIFIFKLIKTKKNRWIIMHIASLGIQVPTLIILMREVKNGLIYVGVYILLCTISSFVVYKMFEYVKSMNLIYDHFKTSAETDFLTGLDNVRCFNEKFNELKNHTQEDETYFVCATLDIDKFKNINDTYGHPSGDMVIQQLAQILKKFRNSSTTIARIGGEEFCLLSKCKLNDISEFIYNAEKIRRYTEQKNFIIESGNKIGVTVSIGVTVMHSALENVDAIVKLSDEALYKAKNSGRNIVVINKTEFLENYLYEDIYKDSNELNLVNSKICIC